MGSRWAGARGYIRGLMSEPVYEMLWDCRYCGARKLLGLTHRHCPNCGGQQDVNARYFPPDSERIAVQNHVYVGADILCHYCRNATSRAARHCGTCGAPLTEGQSVQPLQQVVYAPAPSPMQAFAAAPVPVKKRRSVWLWLAPLLLVCFGSCTALAALFMSTRQGTLTVSGLEWKRSIDIEVLGPVSDSAWCDQLPSGASDVRRHREERSTRRIPDGQDCHSRKVDNGDGTFRETQDCSPRYKEEPIYDEKCEFRVNRWHTDRTARAQGTGISGVAWPALPNLRAGVEREGARSEAYTALFSDPKGESYRCDLPQTKWQTFNAGSRWKGGIRRLTGTLDCDSLKP